MKHSSIHFITVLRESYVFNVFFLYFWAFSMRFLRLNSRWFLAFRAFWQSGLSQYSCLPFLLIRKLPQWRQHIMMPSERSSLDSPLFSGAGSSEIILASVNHAISNTEFTSAENSIRFVFGFTFRHILKSGIRSISLLSSSQ